MKVLDAMIGPGVEVDRATYWIGFGLIVAALMLVVSLLTRGRWLQEGYGEKPGDLREYAQAITLANLLLIVPTTLLFFNRIETTGQSVGWLYAMLAVVVVHNAAEWVQWNGVPARPPSRCRWRISR
jgi:uncharacterized membrane protein YhaH (DUF805 family)